MKRVGVIQSNYIPWKGYFDLIHDVDLFLFYDDVQYTKNDWRNRNLIKTPAGAKWLTIPVSCCLNDLIWQVELKDRSWRKNHWMTLEQFYAKAPHFKEYRDFFRQFYMEMEWKTLSELNQFLIRKISTDYLGTTTEFSDSRKYDLQGTNIVRLIDLLKQVGATSYVSGPRGKNYIDDKYFSDAGIELIFKDYYSYPEYPQFHPPFDHHVSILDLLFQTGKDAPHYMWGWREEESSAE